LTIPAVIPTIIFFDWLNKYFLYETSKLSSLKIEYWKNNGIILFMLNNIQALRAFAALNVVFFHIIIASNSYNQGVGFFSFLTGWGANGVDIFFVISGFIMVYIQDKKSRTALSFLYNRIVRIAPIYWLLTILVVSIYFVLPSVFRELKPSLGHFLSSVTFTSQALGYGLPTLYVGWTLEYEMFFYVLFSLGLIFKSKAKSFLAPVLILFVVASLGLTQLMALEFVLGMICAKIYLSERYNHLGLPSFIIGTIILLISIFYKIDVDRFFVYGIPSFFIVFGLINMKQIKNKLLIYLGNASYSIYLIQVFTIPAFYKFSSKFLPSLQTDLVAVLSLIFTTIVGCVLYSLVEKKLALVISNATKKKYKNTVVV
jgi:hypothetical protein